MAEFHHSEESKKKISTNNARYWLGKKRQSPSQESRQKTSATLRGKRRRPLSDEHKMKLSEAHKGHIPWNKGKHGVYSEETLARIRNANIGKHHSEETKQKLRAIVTGISRAPMAEEQKMKLSIAHKGKKCVATSGENHWNWKEGTTSENKKIKNSMEYRTWREGVFTRDDWTCQKCLIRGNRLHPHHVQNFSLFPVLRFIVDNGITFCQSCHKQFHQTYGIKSNTKHQIEEFLVA